jgi:hypothetical protein
LFNIRDWLKQRDKVEISFNEAEQCTDHPKASAHVKTAIVHQLSHLFYRLDRAGPSRGQRRVRPVLLKANSLAPAINTFISSSRGESGFDTLSI